MTAPIVTLTEIKAYLGKTGTDDDVLIASIASNATALAERHTGRVFSVTSNTTYRYSTDGQASLTIHDRPYSDSTRVVMVGGVSMTEGVDCWFLPDRRNQAVTTTIQLHHYDRDWFVRSFGWFDKNLDNPRYYSGGTPNDLEIVGTVGHPSIEDRAGLVELAAWLYWRAKGGASSYAETLTGTEVDLALLPQAYQLFVAHWRIRTSVASV